MTTRQALNFHGGKGNIFLFLQTNAVKIKFLINLLSNECFGKYFPHLRNLKAYENKTLTQ